MAEQNDRTNNYKEILEFWFSPYARKHWFKSNATFDKHIKLKYQSLWEKAKQNNLKKWQETPEGSLALTILFDQFPLNMFRGTAKSYSTEKSAISVARYAISRGFDKKNK